MCNIPLVLTRFQTNVLLSALTADGPQSPSRLGYGTPGGVRGPRVRALAEAGLLSVSGSATRPKYALTDKGRVFAEVLVELEEAV